MNINSKNKNDNTSYDYCFNIYYRKIEPIHQCQNGFLCSACGNLIEDFEGYKVKGIWNYCSGCGRTVIQENWYDQWYNGGVV